MIGAGSLVAGPSASACESPSASAGRASTAGDRTRARRREFIVPDGKNVVLDAWFEQKERPQRTRSQGEPVRPAVLDLDRRRRTCVQRVGEGPLGVRVSVSKAGIWRYDVVVVTRDAELGEATYAVVAEDAGSFAAAEAVALEAAEARK